MTADSLSRIEVASSEGRAQSIRFRQSSLQSLHKTLRSSERLIKDAIRADTGHTESEITLEYALAISELRAHYGTLNLEEDLKSQKSLENLSATTSVGIVYIIPSKRNLFYSVISAVTAALAAGNCVIIELPATLTQVYGVLSKILPAALDADVFACIATKPSEDYLSKCLILDQLDDEATGAKVVAIVDRTANVPQAASAVGSACLSSRGKASYGPDVVLVNEFIADDFISHLVHAVTSKESPAVSQPLSKASSDTLLSELKSNEACKIVMSGENGSIFEIRDRKKVSMDRRIDALVIIVCRITSLDDGIDISNGFKAPLEALFVFAAANEANYLSRFIDARISCVNHIPAELLVGPFAQNHPTIAPSASPRYTPAHFRSPRPRVSQVSHLTSVYNEMIQSRSGKVLDTWARSVVNTPLPAINQDDGKSIGFFDQAIMLAGAVTLSLVGSTMFALFWYQRRRA